jgi:hypothetical protein
MSQEAEILEHLKKHGEIDAMIALQKFNCFRLASRIFDLKTKGHDIETLPVRTETGKTVALYKLRGI